MQRAGYALGLVCLLAVVGCGSSANSWDVVSKLEVKGNASGFIDNASVGRPAQLELKVTSSPGITVRTAYTFLCGDVVGSPSPTLYGPPTRTPFSAVLRFPAGPPDTCRLNLLATKSGAADMTVTLLMRSTPAT